MIGFDNVLTGPSSDLIGIYSDPFGFNSERIGFDECGNTIVVTLVRKNGKETINHYCDQPFFLIE